MASGCRLSAFERLEYGDRIGRETVSTPPCRGGSESLAGDWLPGKRSTKAGSRFWYAARHGRQAADRNCGGGKSRVGTCLVAPASGIRDGSGDCPLSGRFNKRGAAIGKASWGAGIARSGDWWGDRSGDGSVGFAGRTDLVLCAGCRDRPSGALTPREDRMEGNSRVAFQRRAYQR